MRIWRERGGQAPCSSCGRRLSVYPSPSLRQGDRGVAEEESPIRTIRSDSQEDRAWGGEDVGEAEPAGPSPLPAQLRAEEGVLQRRPPGQKKIVLLHVGHMPPAACQPPAVDLDLPRIRREEG